MIADAAEAWLYVDLICLVAILVVACALVRH